MPDDLFDPALRLMLLISIRGQLHKHFVSLHRAHAVLLRNKNIRRNPRVVRQNKPIGPAFLIRADHFVNAVLQNSQNAPLLPLSGRSRQQQYLYRILMQRTADVFLCDKNILLAPFHFHEAKASRMGCKYTGHGLRGRSAVFPLGCHLCLSFQDQCIKHCLQLRAVLLWDLQQHRHLLELHWHILLVVEHVKYHLFTALQLFFFFCLMINIQSFSPSFCRNLYMKEKGPVLCCIDPPSPRNSNSVPLPVQQMQRQEFL